ncbi:MAG: ABC transporter ATP-binding protein [Armatimonadota bacterium]|nr:ABC transporter ATP-binding protein [Armatimonadota bacterium]MDR7475746.1 ABC transporter ATP-binding protein [Armatimonadota bacterium]MDR7538266.1 ABC transporter ATP-binding protein [Armatimonadota bacterium]
MSPHGGPNSSSPPQRPPLLALRELTVYYGRVRALQEISLDVGAGEIVAILGSNGAGKSTTLRAISGLVHPREGSITFHGRDITRLPAEAIVRLGIAHCPEGRKLFPEMTVLENLEMGAYTRNRDLSADLERTYALFPLLRERRQQRAGSLSGGEQQMLAIARALMAQPALLLLDEPSMGLAPYVVREVARAIRALNEAGVTLLLVEQNVEVALRLAHRAYVLENGRIVLAGSAQELSGNVLVRRAYIGS